MACMLTCDICHHEFSSTLANCPYCGALKPDTVEESDFVLKCPRCDVALVSAHVRKSEIHICPTCYGLWLNPVEFKFLTSERDVYVDESIPKNYEKIPILNTPENQMYIKCPRCRDIMNRINYKKTSGVIIDQCADHGFWLDEGELERIRCFVANVDSEDELSRRIDLNKEEIRNLNQELKNVELVQRVTQMYNLKYWLYKNRG